MSNGGGQFSLIRSALLCKSISSWGGTAAHDKEAHDESHLISASLDSAYNKPPVLRQYGLAYLDDNASAFSLWEFEDTTLGDLKKSPVRRRKQSDHAYYGNNDDAKQERIFAKIGGAGRTRTGA